MLGEMHTFRLKGMIQMPRSIIVATILWIFGLYLLINNVMLVARAYNPPTQYIAFTSALFWIGALICLGIVLFEYSAK